MTAYRTPARVTPDPSREAADLRRYEAELRRSQRRRARVVSALKWTGIVALGVGVLVFLVLALYASGQEAKRCERKGGVYLWREGECVRGVGR